MELHTCTLHQEGTHSVHPRENFAENSLGTGVVLVLLTNPRKQTYIHKNIHISNGCTRSTDLKIKIVDGLCAVERKILSGGESNFSLSPYDSLSPLSVN